MRRAPNLNWIRSFEASARLLSFTKAARELELTQAGVRQHVRLLEQEMGEPLFLRLPRALRLTDAGEAYLRVVQESFERLRLGTSDIFGPESEGLVRLRADPSFVSLWLAPRLNGFLKDYPRISIEISTVPSGAETRWAAVDMEVLYESDRMVGGADAVALMGDTMFPVCGPGLGRQLCQPADLMQQRLLHVMGSRRGWTEWLAIAGIKDTGTAATLHTDSGLNAIALAEQGLGVALGHGALVEPLLRQGRLVRPFAPKLETDGIFYLLTPSHSPLRRQPRLFREWLLAEGTRASAEQAEALGAR